MSIRSQRISPARISHAALARLATDRDPETLRWLEEAAMAVCNDAFSIAGHIQHLLTTTRPNVLRGPAGLTLIASHITRALVQTQWSGVSLSLKNPAIRMKARRVSAAAAGQRSGEVRASGKRRFLEWAKSNKLRNPNLSKNHLATLYAQQNPSLSVATLRRYLTDMEGWTEP